jgi:hypothetical protein
MSVKSSSAGAGANDNPIRMDSASRHAARFDPMHLFRSYMFSALLHPVTGYFGKERRNLTSRACFVAN